MFEIYLVIHLKTLIELVQILGNNKEAISAAENPPANPEKSEKSLNCYSIGEKLATSMNNAIEGGRECLVNGL